MTIRERLVKALKTLKRLERTPYSHICGSAHIIQGVRKLAREALKQTGRKVIMDIELDPLPYVVIQLGDNADEQHYCNTVDEAIEKIEEIRAGRPLDWVYLYKNVPIKVTTSVKVEVVDDNISSRG